MVIEVATALAVVHRILNGRNSRPILAIDSSSSLCEGVWQYARRQSSPSSPTCLTSPTPAVCDEGVLLYAPTS